MGELRFAILFDLDGTLIDSSEGIIDAYQHMLSELGLSVSDSDTIREFIGPSIYEVLQTNFGLTGEIVDQGVQLFRRRYRSYGIFLYRKYDGIDEMIRTLRDQGFLLSLATSKLEELAEQIIVDAGWKDSFIEVNGSDSNGERILKKDVVDRALRRLPMDTRAIAMVGDTTSDICAAIETGLFSIGINWGFGRVESLASSGAQLIVTDPQEIVSIAGLVRESVMKGRSGFSEAT